MEKPRQGRHIQKIIGQRFANESGTEDVAPDGVWNAVVAVSKKMSPPSGAGSATFRSLQRAKAKGVGFHFGR